MTPKEVEHYLIENDFYWDKEGKYWKHRRMYTGVTEEYIKLDPNEAFQFVVKELKRAPSRN